MLHINSDKINLDRLNQKIRYILDLQKNIPAPKAYTPAGSQVKPTLAQYNSKSYRFLQKINKLLKKIGLARFASFMKRFLKKEYFISYDVYILEDFMKFDAEQFIQNSYKTILKREPSQEEIHSSLLLLESQKIDKRSFVTKLRLSKEGRRQGVPILGIQKAYLRYLIYATPVVGKLAKSFVLFLFLPSMLKNMNAIDAHAHNLQKQLFAQEEKAQENYLFFKEQLAHQAQAHEAQLAHQAQAHEAQLAHQAQAQEAQKAQLAHQAQAQEAQKAQLTHQAQAQEAHEAQLTDLATKLQHTKLYTASMGQSIDALIAKITQEPCDIPKTLQTLKSNLQDDIYLSFENYFRGTREHVKQNLSYYLPIVQQVVQNKTQSLLDIGCGRGEWLELLGENSIQAKGIDLNKLMVALCHEHSLDVTYEDAITYLQAQKENSLDVISAFHVVEHLDFETLISLFDHAHRVLKKGGIIIFETPNPENLFVGTSSFYTDPTHRNPIPATTLKFLAMERGFSDVEVHKLHPLKTPSLEGVTNQDLRTLIIAAATAQDYSIIGKKI